MAKINEIDYFDFIVRSFFVGLGIFIVYHVTHFDSNRSSKLLERAERCRKECYPLKAMSISTWASGCVCEATK